MRTSRARRRENLALIAGIGVLAVALCPWFDALADRSFAWHMVQHVAMMMVAAPLLLLGAPLRRLMAALPHASARAVSNALQTPVLKTFGSPIVGWLAFTIVLYVTHFSPLYEAALEHEPVHVLEHGLYLGAALLFWNPIVAVSPTHPLPFPVRIFYVFMAMPIGAFLALAIYTTNHPMYPHYVAELGAARALLDQQFGGEVMWLTPGIALWIALVALVAQWLRDEKRKALLADRELWGARDGRKEMSATR
jgi:putative membrane protein